MNAAETLPSLREQPPLFSPDLLPDMPALVEAAKQFAHTGKIVCKNGERAERILTHYLQSGSLRATAQVMLCHPRSIQRVLEQFEASGRLDALKQRLSHKLGLILELGTDDIVERVANGHLKLTSIDVAVLVDKKLLLDGEATQISEQRVAVDVRVEDVIGYLKSKGISAPAIDVESPVFVQTVKALKPG